MGILDTIKKSGAKKAKEVKEPKKVPASPKVLDEKKIVASDASNMAGQKDTKDAYKILLKPLVTEKSTELANHGKYVFVVAPTANKIIVAKAIEALYDVKVTDVNMINQRGKVVHFGGKIGKRKNVRKAIVTLKKGQKIAVYEGV